MYQTQKLTYLFDSLYAVNNICFWHYTKDWELLDTVPGSTKSATSFLTPRMMP